MRQAENQADSLTQIRFFQAQNSKQNSNIFRYHSMGKNP